MTVRKNIQQFQMIELIIFSFHMMVLMFSEKLEFFVVYSSYCAPKLNNFIDEPVRDRSFENATIRIHNWIRDYCNFSPKRRSIEY